MAKTAKKTAKKAPRKTTSKKATKSVGAKRGTLVIVESPAKAATIEKYLGAGYTVKASMGHLIDLPKSRMAVNFENDFEPDYITVRGRAKILKELTDDAKRSARVLLASDNDREGEAIAYHLRNAIAARAPALPIARISFNEITPQAIREAVAHPGMIDEKKVEAQKARRVLDRLVGYNLSPLLWKKVKNGLSAGRVQSVALRMICEREAEVAAFRPEEYWTLGAAFCKAGGKSAFKAELVKWQGAKPEISGEAAAQKIIAALKNRSFRVADVRVSEKTLRPKAPFTTSQLQQTAANRLGFTSKKTMQLAQQLYEGIDLGKGKKARVGLITYMRTDSTRIAKSALEDARAWLAKHHGDCLPPAPIEYAAGKSAQDAHEAIRPTYTEYTPDYVAPYLSRDHLRLYTIIWERFVSSQMINAKSAAVSIDIEDANSQGASEALFRLTATRLVMEGFYKVLKLLASKEEKGTASPNLQTGDALSLKEFLPEQHWTQGPARYTDASIIKTLEEKGIGRPSTYAPIISVLLDRYYVTRTNRQLTPTILGRLTNDMLVEYFSNVVDADFTAGMEKRLDGVEDSSVDWHEMMRNFYGPFKARVDEVGKSLESYKGNLDQATDEVCEKCGRPMVKKLGRFGYFLACSGFPECRNAKSVPLGKCPKCGGNVVARKGKGRSREFYGCEKYPECDFLTYDKPTGGVCPKCGSMLVEKNDKKNGAREVCINTECGFEKESENE